MARPPERGTESFDMIFIAMRGDIGPAQISQFTVKPVGRTSVASY
jgi:hypothetical protein